MPNTRESALLAAADQADVDDALAHLRAAVDAYKSPAADAIPSAALRPGAIGARP